MHKIRSSGTSDTGLLLCDGNIVFSSTTVVGSLPSPTGGRPYKRVGSPSRGRRLSVSNGWQPTRFPENPDTLKVILVCSSTFSVKVRYQRQLTLHLKYGRSWNQTSDV